MKDSGKRKSLVRLSSSRAEEIKKLQKKSPKKKRKSTNERKRMVRKTKRKRKIQGKRHGLPMAHRRTAYGPRMLGKFIFSGRLTHRERSKNFTLHRLLPF